MTTASSIPQPKWARIVIVAFNSGVHLQRCVDAIACQSFTDFEVVIVDNATPDDSVETLKLPDSRFSVLTSAANLGFAGGCNLGAHGAISEWLIMLNPDCFANSDWLEALHKGALKYPFAASLASTQVSDENPQRIDGCGDVFSVYGTAWRGGYHHDMSALPSEDHLVFSACGAAAAFKTDVFHEHGGFDEAYFCYLEDVDLGLRLQMAGETCVYIRNARVVHIGSAATGRESYFQFYHSSKNNLRLLVKNLHLWLLPIVLSAYFFSQIYLIFRNRKHPQIQAKKDGHLYALSRLIDSYRARPKKANIRGRGNLPIWKWLVVNPKKLQRCDLHLRPLPPVEHQAKAIFHGERESPRL